ncbi:MAG: hypothetical protein Q9160_003692 [Pyrenula sp. 1 TL-2023]
MASSVVAPPWLDHGDNAWQLTAASLVGLQSIPGLVVIYAGIVKKKWAINSAFMAFYAFAAVLICWVRIFDRTTTSVEDIDADG